MMSAEIWFNPGPFPWAHGDEDGPTYPEVKPREELEESFVLTAFEAEGPSSTADEHSRQQREASSGLPFLSRIFGSAASILLPHRRAPQGEDSNGALSGGADAHRGQDAPPRSATRPTRDRTHTTPVMQGGLEALERHSAPSEVALAAKSPVQDVEKREPAVAAVDRSSPPNRQERAADELQHGNNSQATEARMDPLAGEHSAAAHDAAAIEPPANQFALKEDTILDPSDPTYAQFQEQKEQLAAQQMTGPDSGPKAEDVSHEPFPALDDLANIPMALSQPLQVPHSAALPLQDIDMSNLGLASSMDLQAAMHGFPGAPLDAQWAVQYMSPNGIPDLAPPFSEPPQSEADPASQTHAAFAKLEFDDGAFYMTTYAVELGRDMRAYKLARQYTVEAEIQRKEEQERSNSGDRVPQTPVRQIKSAGPASVARSFVSESGGIIGEDDEHVTLSKKKRRKSQKSKSDESVDSQVLRKNDPDYPDDRVDPYTQQGTVDPNATARLNPSAHMGDPNFVPLVPIHPANLFSNPTQTGKGISRKHVKIAYNFDTGKFEMSVFGRNGVFLDDQHFAAGAVVPLRDGSKIQIGGVHVKFLLPNRLLNDDGEPEPSESVSGRMSFSFEDGQGESIIASDSGSPSQASIDDPRTGHYLNGFPEDLEDEEEEELEDDEDEDEDDEDDDEEEEESDRPAPRLKLKASKAPQKKPGKAPRGRPPGKKSTTKLKLKMGVKKPKVEEPPKPKVKEKGKEKAKEKEIVSPKATKTVPKPAPKEVKEKSKDASKEPTKEPTNEPTPSDQPKAIRVARDEPLQNGVGGILIKELPPGFVVPPRKKGPGRPPKDGIMSKRERQLLLKQHKENEKARALGLDPTKLPPPEPKPKPAPRRNSQGELIEAEAALPVHRGSIGADDKTERPPRPPRSPSPEMRIEDYTEEQLQRPGANYVLLIHEAITNSKQKKLNLQQIYSSIERKWPYFKFKVTSNGWQSSVRHNLGQHPAFKQIEKDGKGWLWGIAEGVPIERERKKKASPPPQAPPHHHPGAYGSHQFPYGGYPGAAKPGYGAPAGFAPPGRYQPPQPPRFVPPTAAPQAAEAKQSTYYSPYDTGSKAGEGAGGPPVVAHGLPNFTGGPGITRASGSPLPQAPPPSRTPEAHQLSGVKWQQPSQDLIDTFRRVFIGTSAQPGGGMDQTSAARIVDNAIKRVLEPETMVGVPIEKNEYHVATAFESCLEKSQGPRRKLTTGEPASAVAGATATTAMSMAQSAALTAAAPANNPALAPGPSTAASPQAQPQPERPAAVNLISMLTGAGRPMSPSVGPPAQQPPSVPTPSTPPDPANTAGTQAGGPPNGTTSQSVAAVAPAALPSTEVPRPNGIPAKIDIARANGTSSPMRPAVEPLTPPAWATAAASTTPPVTAATAATAVAVAGAKRPLEANTSTDENAPKKLKVDEVAAAVGDQPQADDA
jgi:Forkhead domain/FHA domain